jgi:putative flippase GtrA
MIKRELAVFLVVGSLTVLIDFLTYRSLVWTGWMNINLAKAIGFLTGTLFAYFANRVWTFGHQEHAPGSVWRFVLLYAITLSANVLVNAGCLALLSPLSIAVQVAFLIATGVSAVLNFLGMKLFVFKASVLMEKS